MTALLLVACGILGCAAGVAVGGWVGARAGQAVGYLLARAVGRASEGGLAGLGAAATG